MNALMQVPGYTVKQLRPKFQTFMKYARVELKPPGPGDVGEIAKGFKNLTHSFATAKWRHLTVKEAWLNTLVALEISMWFFVGECIGKRHLVGYYVTLKPRPTEEGSNEKPAEEAKKKH